MSASASIPYSASAATNKSTIDSKTRETKGAAAAVGFPRSPIPVHIDVPVRSTESKTRRLFGRGHKPSKSVAHVQEEDDNDQKPLLETSITNYSLPFSTARASSKAHAYDDTTKSASSHSRQKEERRPRDRTISMGARPTSSSSSDKKRSRSKRRGDEPPHMICLGVAASAGQMGKGRSGRWVKDEVAFDQIMAFGLTR